MKAEIRYVPSSFSNIAWNVAESGIQFSYIPHDCSPELQGEDPKIIIAMPEQVFVPHQHSAFYELPLAIAYQLPSRVYWVLKDVAKVHVTDSARRLERHAALSIEPSHKGKSSTMPDERFSPTALSSGWEMYNVAQFYEMPSCAGEYTYSVYVTMGNEFISNSVLVKIHMLS